VLYGRLTHQVVNLETQGIGQSFGRCGPSPVTGLDVTDVDSAQTGLFCERCLTHSASHPPVGERRQLHNGRRGHFAARNVTGS
jgi:hypothetical protein